MPRTGFVTDYLLQWYVAVSLAVLAVLWIRRARRLGATPLRLLGGNALLVAALGAFAFVAGETWFRYGYDATDSYGLTMTNWAWFGRHFEANSWGLRDREPQVPRPGGVRRIAFLGDSFVAGYGVADPAARFPDLVRAELERRGGSPIDVWNAGGIGWSTGDELAWLREVQPQARFDHVVLAYCLNDADDLLTPAERFDRRSVRRSAWFQPWQSFFADFLWFRLNLARDTRVDGYYGWVTRAYEDEAVWARQAARIRALGDYCRTQGIRFDAVVFPLFDSWGDGYAFDAAHDRVVAAFQSAGARVLDLRATYRGIPGRELVANRYDAHPNPRAHELAARAILAAFF